MGRGGKGRAEWDPVSQRGQSNQSPLLESQMSGVWKLTKRLTSADESGGSKARQ